MYKLFSVAVLITMYFIIGLFTDVFAQTQVTAVITWPLSVNPDVDRAVLVVWKGIDMQDNPIYEDSSYQDINPAALFAIDTVDVFSMDHRILIPADGDYLKFAGIYLNTSGMDSPMTTTPFVQLPDIPNRPFKMDSLNVRFEL
jgi:hypothetical protein